MRLIINRVFFLALLVLSPSAMCEISIENPEWYIQDDFEGSEDSKFWDAGHDAVHGASCSSDPNQRGKVLKFTYKKGVPEPNEGWSEKRFWLPMKARQIEMSYRLFVPGNYVHAPKNHKNFVFWSGKYGGLNANMSIASESWPASGGAKPSLNISEDGHNYGHSDLSGGRNMYDDRQGSWVNMHVYIELAEKEGDIGLVEIHRNGVLVAGTKDPRMKIAYTGAPPVNQQMKFSSRGNFLERGYLLGWVNGGFQETTVFCVDDFTMKANSNIRGASASSRPRTPSSVVALKRD